MGKKWSVIATLLVILDKRKFDQSFDLPGLASVKRGVGLEPGKAACLLWR